ncbi:MAG: threonylcarbamoyl-AMP synthase [Gammaproteobacteria bacterium]|nr:MAG: threonylcarbamoyl-AMP synthase [Gammaproteobacteria bacterium]
MSLFLEIHPDNPQRRLVRRAVEILRAQEGNVMAYPTDSSYALGCLVGDKAAMERIRRIRRLDKHHNFTLVVRDLSEIATYARVDNRTFRFLKAHTPGPYTFILRATGEVPRRLQHPKRRTIGLRVPDHRITQALLEELGEPLMSSTLILPGDDLPLTDPYEIRERLGKELAVIIAGGYCVPEPTTVIDMTGEVPVIVRQGQGVIEELA